MLQTLSTPKALATPGHALVSLGSGKRRKQAKMRCCPRAAALGA
jgi:hypothetical protein